ncbi:hypothetical protein [Pseudomonas phage PARCL1pr]|nr:hypothetical protein [Pseudomonas phage PARCL1pr]
MLKLGPAADWMGSPPVSQAPAFAHYVLNEVCRESVREWIEASPMSDLSYRNLRWVLAVVACSEVVRPRRLTWWERITGRLKP